LGDGVRGEGGFDVGEGVVEDLVEGAEFFGVFGEIKGTGSNALDRVDCVDDVQECDLLGRAGELKSAVGAAAGRDEFSLDEGLHDFGDIIGGGLGDGGDVFGGGGEAVAGGEGDDGAEGIFDGQ